MFKSILKDYKQTRESIEQGRAEQQQRLKDFDEKHQRTLESMNRRRKEFSKFNDEIDKELSRHF